jgi:SAM-dependent methyltransferase
MKRLKGLASTLLFPLIGYRPQQVSQEAWDREYSAGAWDYLSGIENVAGLAGVMGYCQHLAPRTILLRLLAYEHYLGLDISKAAIARANANLGDDRTRFEVTDLHGFESGRLFDAIIFNQSLYYLSEPQAVLKCYAAMLSPGGHFIISMADQPRTRTLWPLAEAVLKPLDMMDTQQGKGRVITKILAPR